MAAVGVDEKKGCATLANPVANSAEKLTGVGELAAQRALGDMQVFRGLGHRQRPTRVRDLAPTRVNPGAKALAHAVFELVVGAGDGQEPWRSEVSGMRRNLKSRQMFASGAPDMYSAIWRPMYVAI
jgi:hypothetical protein